MAGRQGLRVIEGLGKNRIDGTSLVPLTPGAGAAHLDWSAPEGSWVISVFSLQPVGIMDPLSLLIRSFSISIFPWFNYAVRSTFDALYAANPVGISAVSEPVYDVLKKTVLTFNQTYYRQGVFIGVLFLTVLGLNLVEKRFWCKYLCPLGALLGLLSRFSLLKRSVSEGCTECGACGRACQGAADPDVKGKWKDAEGWHPRPQPRARRRGRRVELPRRPALAAGCVPVRGP